VSDERRGKAYIEGQGTVEGVEIGVSESIERWTEVKLDDGSVVRLKVVVIGALRLDGRYDPEGNPVYTLKVNPIMAVVSAPEHLRRQEGTRIEKQH
jgi:hypothetical protein